MLAIRSAMVEMQNRGGRMTECPKCKGYGIVGSAVPDILRGRGHIFSSNECDRCHGSGEVEQTNEEYLHSLNTEQLAEWFGDWHSFSCVFCMHWKNGCVYNHNQVRCAIEEGKSNKELWMEWLKQPHHEKE